MEIIFNDETVPEIVDVETFNRAACEALKMENVEVEDMEISVSFVSAEEIKEINNSFRGVDKVTDVLSFPQYDDLSTIADDMFPVLGDVVICLERAHQQALEYGHSDSREIAYLFVHSMFHLLGYDHMEEDEKRQMRQREEAVMEAIGLTRE